MEIDHNLRKLLPTIYKDLAQPSIRKLGIALSNLIEVPTFILNMISSFPQRGNKYLEANIKKFAVKLEKETSIRDDVIPITPEIGIPIFEKFPYLRDEDLVNSSIQLLVNASRESTNHFAHPRFVLILLSISNDEVKILDYLNNRSLPYIKAGYHIRTDKQNQDKKELPSRFTPIRDLISMTFNENESIYFANLESLGMIKENQLNNQEGYFQKIIEERNVNAFYSGLEPGITRDNLQKLLNENKDHIFENPNGIITVFNGYRELVLTELGYFFCRSCIGVEKYK